MEQQSHSLNLMCSQLFLENQ